MRLAHWFRMVFAAAAPLVAAAGTTCITDVMVVGGGQRDRRHVAVLPRRAVRRKADPERLGRGQRHVRVRIVHQC